jgi:PAS domain S-box-containing protein
MRASSEGNLEKKIMTQNLSDDQHAFLALFRDVLDAAPDPTLVVDPSGRIIFANLATESVLQWAPQALNGQMVECLVPLSLRHQHINRRESYAARPLMRAMGAGRELTAVRFDGVEIPVEISLNPIPYAGGVLTICALRDISERKRVEQALFDLNIHLEERVIERTRQLKAANGELEMLAYSIAHDLRAPLRAISGFSARIAEALQSGTDQESIQGIASVLSRASKMNAMIDDYLHLLAAGREELICEAIDMEALAHEVLAKMEFTREANITIDAMPLIYADRGLMREVWVQLVDNALKFTANRAKATIQLMAREDERYVHFSVADNGIGFDPLYAGKLFRLFERLHSVSNFAGNGIGLCLVKRIVERHGGGIAIEGAPDEGAKVTFWIPKNRA